VLENLTIDEVEEYFPGFKAFIDSAEQEIPRPKNKRKKKSYYSCKKKKHTVKTQYMVKFSLFWVIYKSFSNKAYLWVTCTNPCGFYAYIMYT